jgi:hypothetical protein
MFERARNKVLEAARAWRALLLTVVLVAPFALLTPRGLPNGDAALYAQQVLNLDFASRPVHLGYFLLAAVASLFQDVPDRFFNLLSCVFAAATLVVTYLLARRYLERDAAEDPAESVQEAPAYSAAIAPMALYGNFFFLENAVLAEVYGVATFFLLLALLLWLYGRDLLAGLSLGIAGLVTPSAALFAPAFLLAERPRPRPRRLAILAATAGAVVLLPIVPLWGEYFYGDRGLLSAAGRSMSPLQMAAKEGFELGVGFLALWPLLALGIWRAARRKELRPFLLAWTAVWATTLALGERFSDVPAQLPAFTLAAVFVAFGIAELVERWSTAPWLWWLVCLGGALAVAGLWLVRKKAASLGPLDRGPTIFFGILVLALLAVAGWRLARRAGASVAVPMLLMVPLFVNQPVATRILGAKTEQIDDYRSAVESLEEKAAPDFLAIGTWERCILLEHYLFRRSYTEHAINTAWLDGRWGEERQKKARQDLAATLAAGREVWLLGPAPQVEAELAAAGYYFHSEFPSRTGIRQAVKAAGRPECRQCP